MKHNQRKSDTPSRYPLPPVPTREGWKGPVMKPTLGENLPNPGMRTDRNARISSSPCKASPRVEGIVADSSQSQIFDSLARTVKGSEENSSLEA